MTVGDRGSSSRPHDPERRRRAGARVRSWSSAVGWPSRWSPRPARRARRRRQRDGRADGRGARPPRCALIGEVAPLVQQSLELAEVLPSVAVQLSDHFEPRRRGAVHGIEPRRPDRAVQHRRRARPVREAGAPAARAPRGRARRLRLALQRGGRSVALLQVVAGRDLDAERARVAPGAQRAHHRRAGERVALRQPAGGPRAGCASSTASRPCSSAPRRTSCARRPPPSPGFAGLLTSSWDRFTEEQRRDFVEPHRAPTPGRSARSCRTSSTSRSSTAARCRCRSSPSTSARSVGGVVDRLAPAFTEHEVEADIEPDPAGGGRSRRPRARHHQPPHQRGEVLPARHHDPGRRSEPSATTSLLEVCDQGPGRAGRGARARLHPLLPRQRRRRAPDPGRRHRPVRRRPSSSPACTARSRVDDAPGGGARFTVRLPAATTQTLEEVADATTP